MNAEPQTGPTPLETLQGYGSLLVSFADPSRPSETVFIRQLPLREMEALLGAQGDEMLLAQVYTGKDAAWVDSLSAASQEAVVSEGDRINADFFGRWFRRRLERQESMLPGSKERLFAALNPSAPSGPPPPGPSRSLQPLRVVPAG